MKNIHRYNTVFKFIAIPLFLISTLISFTACENFLQGEDVMNEINKVIEYNNSKSHAINVEVVDDSCGKIKTPATGEITKKVTDVFSVRFEPAADHQFIKWEAVIKDLGVGEKASDYIEFENEESLESRVTFKKASGKIIVIRPVCPAKLTYSFYQGGGEVYPRDSTIEFNFNEVLGDVKLQEFVEDYVTISNLPEGITAATYFHEPVIRGKTIKFRADTSNGYIPVANNTQRVITVRIPKESIWYINEQYSQPVKVYLDADIKETYLIGPETSTKTKFKYVLPQEDDNPIGSLKIDGEECEEKKEYGYSIGQTAILRYKIPDGYTFKKWLFTDALGKELSISDLHLSTEEEIANNISQLTITIDNYRSDVITITPLILDPVKMKFLVEDDYSTTGEFKVDGIVATGIEQNIVPGKPVNLRFKLTDDAYYFKGWKLKRTYTENGIEKTVTYEKDSFINENLSELGFSVSYDDNEFDFGYESITKVAQASILIDDYIDGSFSISPVITAIPTTTVTIDGTNGKFSPAKGTYRVKEKVFDNLSFDPDGDYEFIRWQIYDETTGEEFNNADYITINDVKAERTSYAVVKVPDSENIKLAIRPVVTERPQILSYSPMFNTSGTLRDTTIQVLFDYDMSETSIYYTANELASLRQTLKIADNEDVSTVLSGNKLLFVMKNGVKNYYGYKTSGATYLKNLSIKNNRTGESLNSCYIDPVFETPRCLSLKVDRKGGAMPPEYSQISVSIERGFFYELEGKSILMSGAKKWIYQVGATGDNSGPAVEKATIKYYTGKNDQNEDEYEELVSMYTDTNKVIQYTTAANYTKPTVDQSNYTGIESLKYIAEKGDKQEKKIELAVELNVNDNNATSSSFNVYYNKIYDSNYKCVENNSNIKSLGVYYDSTMGTLGQYNNAIDLSFLDDGIYAIWFSFPDANGYTTFYPELPADHSEDDYIPENKFYIAIDRTAPQVISPTITDGGKQKYLKLNWNYEQNTCSDIKEVVIRYAGDDAQVYTALPDTYNTGILDGADRFNKEYILPAANLIGGKHYSVDVIYKDWAGHSVTYNLDDSTIPCAPIEVSIPSNHETTMDISCPIPDDNFSGIRVRYREKGTTRWLPEIPETDKDGNPTGNYIHVPIENTTKTPKDPNDSEDFDKIILHIEGLDYAKKYEFEICSYDLASGKESPVYKIGNALPEYVTKPASARISGLGFNGNTDSGTIYYYTPNSAFSGLKIIYSTASNYSNASTYEIPDSSSNSYGMNAYRSFTLSSSTSGALTPGTYYYFKIVAWYNDNNNTVQSNAWSSYTKTAPVTNLSLDSRTSNSLTVKWTKPAGNCSKYKIEYKEASASNWESAEMTTTATEPTYTIRSYNNAPLVGGKAYNVRVTAHSYNDSAAVDNGTAGWKTYPNAVTNVSAQKQSSTSIKVSWTNPTGYYDAVKILKAESEAGLSSVAATTPSYSTYHTFTGLSQGKEYFFKIITYVYSNPSNPSAGFITASSQVYQCSTDIDPVTNPAATANSDSKITLTWTNPDSASYDGVQVSSNNGSSWTDVSGKTTTSYSYTGLTPNTSYTFKIRTYKTVGNETKYAAANAGTVATKASAVTSLTYNSSYHTATSVRLTWTNPTNTSYWNKIEVYAGTSKLGEVTSKTQTYFDATNLTPGTKYYFYVKTINKDGIATSTLYELGTKLDIAKDVTISDPTTSGATVSWTLPQGSYTYLYVYYKLNSSSSWSSSSALASTTTSYTIGSLSLAKKYDVKVVTYKNSWSNQETAVSSFYTKPNGATGFSCTGTTENSMSFSWTKPTGDFGRYDVVYKKYGDSDSQRRAAYYSTSATSATISNLIPGENYEVFLRVAPSSGTETINFNSAACTQTLKLNTKPKPVTGLSASYSSGKLKITWSKPEGNHNYYQIGYKKSSESDSYWQYSWISGGSTTEFDTSSLNLSPGVKYDFKMRTNCDRNGVNSYSAFTSVISKYTPPPAATSASIYSDDGMGNVQIKFTYPSYTGVNLGEEFTVNGSYANQVETRYYSSGSTSYNVVTISNFKRGTSYKIKVQSYGNFEGSWIYGGSKEITVSNSSGNICINGKSYDNTKLMNVITSSTTISKKNTGGSFTSGNSITLTPYSMGAYEVTGELFKAVMGTSSTDTTTPVTQVSWYAAIAFCNKLSAIMGFEPCYTIGTISNSEWKTFSYSSIPTSNNETWNKAKCDFTKNGYHLPTEWQWEFAARGGSTSASDWNYDYAGGNVRNDVSWNNSNASSILHVGGLKAANRLGLYDMTGNLWEWVTDWGNASPSVTATDFTVNYDSSYRTSSNLILRGGAYSTSDASWMYTKYRLIWGTGITKNFDIGFRICRNKTY